VRENPELLLLREHGAVPDGLKVALGKPGGARFFRCALQVNPFEYAQRHDKPQTYSDEAAYNAAIVSACLANDIEIVGVTDHFRIRSAEGLIDALTSAGITVFPGFEASSSEGVHFLSLFQPGSSIEEIERHIGSCGVVDLSEESPQSNLPAEQLIEHICAAGGLAIAAHVVARNGLLTTLQGQARARVWKNSDLLAVALPGPRDQVQDQYRQILKNQDVATKRPRPVAVINCNDVSDPAALNEPSATTRIKMSEQTIEGLRQAFLDWTSRVRLNSEVDPSDHIEIIAVAWAGGLLDGQSVHLNPGLNVLVGGRGAGKSTLIESLRYAFEIEPKGEESRRNHGAILREVLGHGATVSVLIRSPNPSPQFYVIERIFGNRANVRNGDGDLTDLRPGDITGAVEFYGQHEVYELTRQPTELATVLRRFTGDAVVPPHKSDISLELARSRESILQELAEIDRLEESIAVLPSLRERLRRFAEAGLADRLKAKADIDTEMRAFEQANDLVTNLRTLADEVEGAIADEPLLTAEDVAELPNGETIKSLNEFQQRIKKATARAASYLRAVADTTNAKIAEVNEAWSPASAAVEEEYEQTLRDLKAEGHDGHDYIVTRDQVERLKPKEAELQTRRTALEGLLASRRERLIAWEQVKAEDFRSLTDAARRVSRRLNNKVRVTVRRSGDLSGLEAALREHCPGNISQAIERLKAQGDLSLPTLAENIREGATMLVSAYGFTQQSAGRIADGGEELALAVEECEIETDAVVELNVGSDAQPVWKELNQLSTGQKATAVLLLLLLQSEAPLIVDQPEDDLDNRFIADSIVPTMRSEKCNRQFLFSSHNANIPVLGDAEQIIGLTPTVEDGAERTVIADELCGSIDRPEVKQMIKDLLEGGQEAFDLRREKYGF
jgi:energy-coupling factor transporter ATP-binding protein EcfA2